MTVIFWIMSLMNCLFLTEKGKFSICMVITVKIKLHLKQPQRRMLIKKQKKRHDKKRKKRNNINRKKKKEKKKKKTPRTKQQKKKLSYQEKKEWETIEDEITKLEEKIEEIKTEIAASGSDIEKVQRLYEEQQTIEATLDNKMERW